jgi:hypothetical protein
MLGHKLQPNNSRLGEKYSGKYFLGNKGYSGFKSTSNIQTNSPDGIIHNDFNSAEAHKEPMKGVVINYARKVPSHNYIEKQRKRTDSKEKHYV